MELLTIREVADRLKIGVNLVYKLIKAGHLKALKLGCLKVTSLEFERFLIEANGKDFSDLENVVEFKM